MRGALRIKERPRGASRGQSKRCRPLDQTFSFVTMRYVRTLASTFSYPVYDKSYRKSGRHEGVYTPQAQKQGAGVNFLQNDQITPTGSRVVDDKCLHTYPFTTWSITFRERRAEALRPSELNFERYEAYTTNEERIGRPCIKVPRQQSSQDQLPGT